MKSGFTTVHNLLDGSGSLKPHRGSERVKTGELKEWIARRVPAFFRDKLHAIIRRVREHAKHE